MMEDFCWQKRMNTDIIKPSKCQGLDYELLGRIDYELSDFVN